MRRIQGVSYPRSGHGLLVRVLARYFSGDPDFKVDGGEPDIAGSFGYCEFYRHCRSVPCTDKRVTFQKNHDFDLRLPKHRHTWYLVQYREPLPAIISDYELQIRKGRISEEDDCERRFLQFLSKRLGFYALFKKKWVDPPVPSNICIIKYEELTVGPIESLRKAILFCEPDKSVDEAYLTSLVEKHTIAGKRDIRKFRYYRPVLEQIEAGRRDYLRYYLSRLEDDLRPWLYKPVMRILRRLS